MLLLVPTSPGPAWRSSRQGTAPSPPGVNRCGSSSPAAPRFLPVLAAVSITPCFPPQLLLHNSLSLPSPCSWNNTLAGAEVSLRGAGVPSAPVSCTSRYQLALGGPRGVCPINRSAAPRRGSTAAGPRTQTQASGRGHPSCGSGTLPCPLRKAATAAAPSTEPAALQLARTAGAAPSSAGNVPTPPQMHKPPSSGAPCPQKGSGWRQPRTGPPPVGLRRLRAGLGAAAWENPTAARRLRLNGGAGYGAGGQLRPEPPLPTSPPRWASSSVAAGTRCQVRQDGPWHPRGGSLTSPLPSMGFLLALWAVGSHVHVPEGRAASVPPLSPVHHWHLTRAAPTSCSNLFAV